MSPCLCSLGWWQVNLPQTYTLWNLRAILVAIREQLSMWSSWDMAGSTTIITITSWTTRRSPFWVQAEQSKVGCTSSPWGPTPGLQTRSGTPSGAVLGELVGERMAFMKHFSAQIVSSNGPLTLKNTVRLEFWFRARKQESKKTSFWYFRDFQRDIFKHRDLFVTSCLRAQHSN